jgi:hypothetical protein
MESKKRKAGAELKEKPHWNRAKSNLQYYRDYQQANG